MTHLKRTDLPRKTKKVCRYDTETATVASNPCFVK